MVIRIIVGIFASLVVGLGYLTGMARMITALLLGLGSVGAFIFGVVFVLPSDSTQLILPSPGEGAAWPYFVISVILVGMALSSFKVQRAVVHQEQVSSRHFKFLIAGLGSYLVTLFWSSVYWFPAEESATPLNIQLLFGTSLFFVGISLSCYCLYQATKGSSDRHPDLLRRFVLAFFGFFHLDKVPLVVAYLVIYSPDIQGGFPYLAPVLLLSYIPIGIFLLNATWDSK